ncbi:MAG: TonB family protein [Gammaproteobacteria bacterium]
MNAQLRALVLAAALPSLAAASGSDEPKGAPSANYPAPVPMERIKPRYPGAAWTARLEGYVRVDIEVLANGDVGAIKTLDAEHGDVFEPAVMTAVKTWRFEPSTYQSRHFIQRIDFDRRGVLLPSLVHVPDTPYFNPDE